MKPTIRLTFIFEFGPSGDWMLKSLATGLKLQIPNLEIRFIHGLSLNYTPGGFHVSRLLNLCVVYLRTAWHFLISSPDIALVRTTPPGIQLWALACSRPRRVPVICWLMDYHPEIEARGLAARGFTTTAAMLRAIDRAVMRRFEAIIVLDGAMAELARARSAGRQVIEHPTWSASQPCFPRISRSLDGNRTLRRLVYAGHLGEAHDIYVLEQLLLSASRIGQVELYVIGSSPGGEARFRRVGAAIGVRVHCALRVPFAELRTVFEAIQADIGVVLLSDESVGLVSPSKFSGYIAHGLPVLYIGPAKTNCDRVCAELGGGLAIRNSASKEEIEQAASWIWDGQALARAAEGSLRAKKHFDSFSGDSLADFIIPVIKGRSA